VRQLTGTNWGASAETLRTASLTLDYSTAEYCAPVWLNGLNSVHTNKIDIQLNNTMRLISGTVKSTQLQWLPVLANIVPPKLRRKATTVCELMNCRRHARSLLYEQMLDIPDQRLLSRRSMWNFDPHLSTTLVSIPDAWTAAWSALLPVNGDLIVDSNVRPPGFDLRRHNWVLLNRFRTEHGKCAHLMHRWWLWYWRTNNASHRVHYCPLQLFADGLTGLCAMSDETVEYLSGLDFYLFNYKIMVIRINKIKFINQKNV
jgi:hypothetical protein